MFGNLSDKFESVLRSLSGKGKISESNVRDAMAQVREALLEADVHYEVAEAFCDRVVEKAVGAAVLEAVEPGQQMIKIVHDELVRLLGETAEEREVDPATGQPLPVQPIMYVAPGPTILMMTGLQGSGKTTTCGKLAAHLKKKGKSVMLCAADLQRPAAVTQLRVLSEQVDKDVEGPGKIYFHGEPDKVAEYGKAVGAAVDVCRNAVKAAKASGVDVLILDTAGRLHLNDELMGELRRVNAAVMPHQVFLVIDAMTGQDAVNSAKAFNEQLELDGIILTKFDSDTRGGAALSVKSITGKPIRYIGTGEKLDAIEEFHADRIASRILGMGDIVSLVEKAQQQVSEEEALEIQEKMAKGQLTMEDFLKQLKQLRRMGSMKSLLGMLPGIGKQIKDLDLDDKHIDRTEAIINSMTLRERRNVQVLDNGRRRRIGKGSGTDPKDVSQLVKGFEMISTMSKQMSNMGAMGKLSAMRNLAATPGIAPGMAGMKGLPRMGGASADKQKPKYKQRKGKKR